MKCRLRLVCIAAALFALPLTAVAWVGQGSAANRDSDSTEIRKDVKGDSSESSTQTSGTSARDPWEGKERVRGWSTAVVVVPPQIYYDHYYRHPPVAYVYDGYYRRQPWGYNGPPVIAVGDRYDAALVWDQMRQGFKWDPIIPPRPNANVPAPIFNPNAVLPPAQYDDSRDSEPAAKEGAPSQGRTEDRVAPPSGEQPKEAPRELGSWQKRGLVSSINREDRQLTIITPQGQFVVDARDATVARSGYRSSLAAISEGDAVKIWAELVGLNKVKADRIEITSAKDREAAERKLLPMRAKGKIVHIDYPSFTFRMETDTGELRVLAGEDARITSPDDGVKAFMDLRLGQTVKIVAVGSLTSGYAASEVVIIQDAPGAKVPADK